MVKSRISGYLAVDLGASSGRVIYGWIENDRLKLRELHRFPVRMTRLNGHWHWDIFRFLDHIVAGLKKSTLENTIHPVSMAVNTWGVDFGLLSSTGELLQLPYAYRDPRTDGMMEKLFDLIPREEIYGTTGIQFMPINSLYQLYELKYRQHSLLEKTKDLLFIPDLLNYFLSGAKHTEFSYATTSQMYNPVSQAWERSFFTRMDIPMQIMQHIIQPGIKIGLLKNSLARDIGIKKLPLLTVVSHDTGSAVVAVPATQPDWLYISSGTWSLLGVEVNQAVTSASACELNFTNEGGFGSTFRLQKNMTGLWLMQQLIASNTKLKKLSLDTLLRECAKMPPFTAFIDGDHACFMNPSDMESALGEYLKTSGQSPITDPFHLIRISLESLSLKYRYFMEQLHRLHPADHRCIHVIGGGSQNHLLNQFTANATGKRVLAGPVEATSIGNIMVQAMAAGQIKSITDARKMVSRSFAIREYMPEQTAAWCRAFKHYKERLYGNE